MPYPNLIDASLAQSALSGVLPANQSALALCVAAASQRVQRYCRRVFPQLDWAEIKMPMAGQYDRNQPDVVHLSCPPIRSSTLNPLATVRSGRTTAILINNSATGSAQDAQFGLLETGDPELGLKVNYGLRLVLFSGGAMTVNTFPLFRQPTSTGFSVVASGGGSSLSSGTYLCSYSNVNPAGESIRSADVSVNVSAGQNLVFTLPTLIPQAFSNNVYVSTAGGGSGTETVQNTTPIVASPYTVSSLASGASPQSTSYGTLTQLEAGINALGNGWQAVVQQTSTFANWFSDDLWASQGMMIGCLSTGETQGLDIFADTLVGAQIDEESASIFLPQNLTAYGRGPGNIWQWPDSADYANADTMWREPVLVKYSGGYPTVPEDIQEATLRVVRDSILNLTTNTRFSEETIDKWQYRLTASRDRALSADVRMLLAPYVLQAV